MQESKDIIPIIIEDDDDQDISYQTGTKSSTSRDTKSPIQHLPNQIYPQPTTRLPPGPPDPLESNHKVTAEIEPNLDFEEYSPHQEGILTDMYESPDKSDLEQPQNCQI